MSNNSSSSSSSSSPDDNKKENDDNNTKPTPATTDPDDVETTPPKPPPTDEVGKKLVAYQYQDLKKTMIKTNPTEIQVSFDDDTFPYQLSPLMVDMIKSIGYLHLVSKEKIGQDLPTLSKFALLSGPSQSEILQENIALALAKEFQATLIVFDPLPVPTSDVIGVVSQLVKIVDEESKSGPLVVFLSNLLVKDIDKYLTQYAPRRHESSSLPSPPKPINLVKEEFVKVPDGVLMIASRIFGSKKPSKPSLSFDCPFSFGPISSGKGGRKSSHNTVSKLFPNEIIVRMPQDESQAAIWKEKLKQDREMLVARRNNARIRSTLDSIGWDVSDMSAICMKEKLFSVDFVSRFVGHAVLHHVQKGTGTTIMSSESIMHGVKTLEDVTKSAENKTKSVLESVITDNMFESKLLAEVVPPSEIGVRFDDVGALEDVKDALKETIMLPLQRPKLFSKGKLRNPVKGVLLFGPPGTGKTMLAKAVATEAGANFISISPSNITSKWHGESEKYANAVFTLASKLAPCVIFMDEVDSMLSSRREAEREVDRRMKNVFMTNWDGLRTKTEERVLVLGATNRPFELDDAVIRRFPRRIMVGLPDSLNREKILRVILSDEELADDVDLGEIANMTDGYSGSDLKQLCIMAAHCPIREILEKEKNSAVSTSDDTDTEVRPLIMEDFKNSHKHVGVSTCSESANTSKLIEWNNMYGEGGSREKQVLTYFL